MIYALVVIYNKTCEESKTLQSIKGFHGKYSIIIFDNSTRYYNNKEYAMRYNYLYFSFGKNLGLSKAYNYVINYIPKSINDYLLILDDDTELTDEYLTQVIQQTKLFPLNHIWIPIVKSNTAIISPCNLRLECIAEIIHDINELDYSRITAINSGMVIRSDVFYTIKYNEKLFLDCVDHDFMRQVRLQKLSIGLLNCNIIQSYSRDDTPQLAKAIFRFKIYRRDLKEYCISTGHGYLYYFRIFKFVGKYSFMYKSFKFIKVLITDGV